jgi:hypothetical protein
VVTTSTNGLGTKNPFSVGDVLYFSGVSGMTQINGLTGTVTAIGGSSGAWTATFNINSSAFSSWTSGGTVGLDIQIGDALLIYASGGNSGTQTFTFPSGFSRPAGLSKININTTTTFDAALKTAVSADTSASTFVITYDVNDFITTRIEVYSGRSGSVTAAAGTTHNTSSSFPITFSLTGVTAASGDDISVCVGLDNGTGADTLTYTPPSGFSNAAVGGAIVANSPALLGCNNLNVASGATGTLAGSCTDTNGSTAAYGAFVVSLAHSSAPSVNSSQFFLSEHRRRVPFKSAGALAALAWVVNRRNRLREK